MPASIPPREYLLMQPMLCSRSCGPQKITRNQAACGRQLKAHNCLELGPYVQAPLAVRQRSGSFSVRLSAAANSAAERSSSEEHAAIATARPDADAEERPCLAGGGGGIFFFWQLGAIKYLLKHYQVNKFQFVGASAGALVVTLAACNVDPEGAVECAYRIAKEAKLWDRRFGLLGIWGGLIRQWLDELLPVDAHELCRERLKLVGTDVWSRKQKYIPDFETREELIQANMCSIHIPFFLDFRPFQYYRGVAYMDGSLTDAILWENGRLLTREGSSFVLDYSQDTELNFKRLDFVKLRSYESVLELLDQGYKYAARLDAQNGFAKYFESAKLSRDVSSSL